jgi:hypothetical protein
MTSPERYSPRNPSLIDALAAAKRTADQLMRNNPLTNAVVGNGLIRFLGNYLTPGGTRVNFLWIGEFFPLDTTLNKPQKGFVLFRDDVTQGNMSIAIYDHDPNGAFGAGLRQTIHMFSGDGKRLFTESRAWGQQWPHENIAMGATGTVTQWPASPTPSDADWHTVNEGRMNVVGNSLDYRFFACTLAGAAGEVRLSIDAQGGQPQMILNFAALGVTSSAFYSGLWDVSAHRGETVTLRTEAKVTNGVAMGQTAIAVVAFRCYSP